MSSSVLAARPAVSVGHASVLPSFKRAASRAFITRVPATRGRSLSANVVAEERLNVVVVGAECAPFSKTGGLGDVMSSLPKVRTFLNSRQYLNSIPIPIPTRIPARLIPSNFSGFC